jgi:hypothetical protein
MKRTFIIITTLVISTLIACKKETTTPSSSTTNTSNNTTANTVYYGNYQGQNFPTTTVTKYYDAKGVFDSNNSGTTSGLEVGACVLSKGSNNSTIITGASFLSLPMIITGTNFVVDNTVVSSNVSGGVSSKQTVSGSGTINNKDLTFTSILTTTVVTSGSFGDSTVSVKTTTGSVHLVE